ncbi:MAG: flagellar basal body rod protein FlgB [Gammaproteobacteria bacterium]|nr:flagellar basal body rod protein FlgB [Gammaproteobacteria bacterium]
MASNLANADTPNYKARDIDFQSAMKMASSNQNTGMVTTNAKHFHTSNSRFESPAVQYRTSVQDSLDGNTVDEQIEQAQFMQNSVQYQASLNFLGGKFKGATDSDQRRIILCLYLVFLILPVAV